jgi:signal-transduction protein with cAMP-binding, CBS, and nucleotidyltransferase domain
MTTTGTAQQFDSATEESVESQSVPKSDETKHLLATALNDHFLFNQLQEVDLLTCVDRMVCREYAVGSEIITQGTSGTEFFVLETGTADAIVDGQVVAEYSKGGR